MGELILNSLIHCSLWLPSLIHFCLDCRCRSSVRGHWGNVIACSSLLNSRGSYGMRVVCSTLFWLEKYYLLIMKQNPIPYPIQTAPVNTGLVLSISISCIWSCRGGLKMQSPVMSDGGGISSYSRETKTKLKRRGCDFTAFVPFIRGR